MLEVYDLQRRKTAILQNAFSIREKQEINAVYTLTFSLPENDKKNEYCHPMHYVRYNGGQLYRIVSPDASLSGTGKIVYNCEHVIATLVDDVLFGSHIVGNIGTYTATCINYILGKQTNRNWVLASCDFSRQFEYAWENENLLASLFSIPNRFTTPYMWQFDTRTYPWKLSLKAIDESATPQFYIRADKNLLSYSSKQAAEEICTRLYCLGYGEGVNQLNIASVNGGSKFLLAPQEKINEYGLVTRIFVDRRFEDPQSLMERGQALLAELQEPTRAKTFKIADLYELTKDELDKAEIGKIARFTEDGTQTFITALSKTHDKEGDISITLKTKASDVSTTIADLADRQRIEQVYSQGATQIFAQSVQANATTQKAAKLNFYLPDEMRIINCVKCKLQLSPFRTYSQSTEGGGASESTSSAGGGTNYTSSSGGGGTQTSADGGGGSGGGTSQAGGGTVITSRSGGAQTSGGSKSSNTGETTIGMNWYTSGRTNMHTHSYMYAPYDNGYGRHYHIINTYHSHYVAGHTHDIDIPAHTHYVSVGIPSHSHSVSIPSHTHSVQIYDHTHTITLPNHTHAIEPGIFEYGNPSSARLYVNGVYKASISNNAEIDITQYLTNANTGKIDRGAWHSVEILPNALAYVTVDMIVQGFIQSRGGSTV